MPVEYAQGMYEGEPLPYFRDMPHGCMTSHIVFYQNNHPYDQQYPQRQNFDQRGQGHESEEAQSGLASAMEVMPA